MHVRISGYEMDNVYLTGHRGRHALQHLDSIYEYEMSSPTSPVSRIGGGSSLPRPTSTLIMISLGQRAVGPVPKTN